MTYFNPFDIVLNPAQFFDRGVFDFTSFDFFSEAWSINSNGDMIVGTIGETVRNPNNLTPPPSLEGGEFHGFTRRSVLGLVADIKRIDFPNADSNGATSVVGCNDHYDVVGFYRNRQNELHGFVWLNGGAPSTFDIPGAAFPQVVAGDSVIHNGVFGINNQRIVVGSYRDARAQRQFGFAAPADDPARFRRIDIPRGPGQPAIDGTRVNGINSQGDIVGSYQVGTSKPFKWKVDSALQLVGTPLLLNHPWTDVTASAINNKAEIVGNDNASNAPSLNATGFRWTPGATDVYPNPPSTNFAEIYVPSTLVPRKTFVNGIDFGGTVVGAYRVNVGNRNGPNRRAFFGFFADAIAPGIPWIPWIIKWIGGTVPVAPPPIPSPFPPYPWWPFLETSLESQNALIGLLMNEMISSITDKESRHRLRAEVLDMVLREVRKLIDKTC